jgi:hypothetical protein
MEKKFNGSYFDGFCYVIKLRSGVEVCDQDPVKAQRLAERVADGGFAIKPWEHIGEYRVLERAE